MVKSRQLRGSFNKEFEGYLNLLCYQDITIIVEKFQRKCSAWEPLLWNITVPKFPLMKLKAFSAQEVTYTNMQEIIYALKIEEFLNDFTLWLKSDFYLYFFL